MLRGVRKLRRALFFRWYLMLKRIIIVFSCICMIGMTIAPSSALVCCCKAHQHGKSDAAAHPRDVPPCCRGAQEQDAAVCKVSTGEPQFQQQCPRCRCIEQLQIVAVCGSPTDDAFMSHAPAGAVQARGGLLVSASPGSALPIKAHFWNPSGSFSSSDILRC